MQQAEPIEQDDRPEAQKKSFKELFSRQEVIYYSVAVLVYIGLGLLLAELILNFVVGPLFFIGWMWVVPPVWERWRGR